MAILFIFLNLAYGQANITMSEFPTVDACKTAVESLNRRYTDPTRVQHVFNAMCIDKLTGKIL